MKNRMYYHVVEHDTTKEIYTHFCDNTEFVAIESAEDYFSNLDADSIKDFPLTFVIHGNNMQAIGTHKIGIGGWYPEFCVIS